MYIKYWFRFKLILRKKYRRNDTRDWLPGSCWLWSSFFYMKWFHIYQTVCVDALHPESCKLWPFVTLTAAYTRLCNQCAQQTHDEFSTSNIPHTHTPTHKGTQTYNIHTKLWQTGEPPLSKFEEKKKERRSTFRWITNVRYRWIMAINCRLNVSPRPLVCHSQWTYLMYIHLYTQKFWLLKPLEMI